MNAALRIAVVGAAGSGKTQLASALGTACSQAAQAVLIADNPPLTAVRQSGIELTLLMGLDLAATGAARPEREAADQALRQALAQAGLSYTVIYGQGPQRLHNALRALQSLLPGSAAGSPPQLGPAARQPAWVWSCDKCSDPQCERRLLSDLLASRST